MTTATPAQPLVRVVKGGSVLDEELAALTAVLLSRAAAAGPQDGDETAAESVSVVPLWERPGPQSPYRSPLSWRN
ncbi:acyl-CoA carboxylase subunit epsilon [Streptomyces sp. NPDC050439]|uniref:acyl-CoA carboxylase subunit epsilon n=1 Tax=unclassified Streptomyces TaxID=2593676 RepID=UPI00341CCDC4